MASSASFDAEFPFITFINIDVYENVDICYTFLLNNKATSNSFGIHDFQNSVDDRSRK